MTPFARAMGYPYDIPTHSYVMIDGQKTPWDPSVDLNHRTPVLACGSNQSPQQLARKFPKGTVPVMAGWLAGYDSVYSAHFTTYGSIAATYCAACGVSSRQMITWLDDQQLEEMHASEALGVNYDYTPVTNMTFLPHGEGDGVITMAFQYESLHGPILLNGQPVALSAIATKGRSFPHMDQETLQQSILSKLAFDGNLSDFVQLHIENPDIRKRHSALLKGLK